MLPDVPLLHTDSSMLFDLSMQPSDAWHAVKKHYKRKTDELLDIQAILYLM
jgi:hypothetical protein